LCVLQAGKAASPDLKKQLSNMIASEMGKPLAPKEVLFVDDLPKTRNAKVMRRMIRAAYLGQDPGDTSSLVNPEAVQQIRRAA
jgi:acetyl-CoA synthetase